MKKVLQQGAFYFAAAFVAFLIVEIGYRVHLLYKDPRIQLGVAKSLSTAAYTRSLWRFDADEGFQYTDRTGIFIASVEDARIAGCSAVDPINKDGSPGISEGNYEDADFKVAVFGDSFSVFVDDGNNTWVSRLQQRLQEKLGRSVHILNFAHDGNGLLQMLDIAAIEIPKRKPDIAIIAFNTDSMMFPRIWRVEKMVAGEQRVITTFYQTENPDLNDPNSAYDTFILDSDVDADWCEKNKKGGELDQVGRDIIDKYLRFRAPRYSALTISRSFFWNRVVHEDAFFAGGKEPVRADEIAKDLKFANDIKSIRESGVPLLLVHLPYSFEVSSGVEFSNKKSEHIATELSRITGQPMHGLIDRIGHIDQPGRMNSSPSNMHPSAFGINLYAEAVSNIILQNSAFGQSKQH